MSAGRHRLLDERKRNEICTLVAAGCTIATTARYIGCDVRTIRREAQRDPEFGERLRIKEIEATLGPIAALQRAAVNDWRAAAWLLQRTHPKQYGSHGADRLPIAVVRGLVARGMQLLQAELPPTPANEIACTRVAHLLDDTCNQLAAALLATNDQRKLRRIVAQMGVTPAPLSPGAAGPAAAADNLRQNTSKMTK